MRGTMNSFRGTGLIIGLLIVSTAQGQSLSWSQTTTGYGRGYVGTPTYAPATSYYRAPAYRQYFAAPVTTYYAPQAPQAPVFNYANVQPAVVPSTYYAPVANYPPRTVFPTVGYSDPSFGANGAYTMNRPVVFTPGAGYMNTPAAYGTYSPSPVVMNYPTPSFYRTNYARTPVTYYRPVTAVDPVYGGPTTVLQPQLGYEYQAQRYEAHRLFPWLHRQNPPVPYAANYAPCCNGSCPAPAAAQPYYVPSPTSTIPYAAPTYTTPGAVPYTAPGSTTIGPPATFTPSTTVPGTVVPSNPSGGFNNGQFNNNSFNNVPANSVPTLGPSEINANPSRRDYPPPVDSYSVPSTPSARLSLPPDATRVAPSAPAPSRTIFVPETPADAPPVLNAPLNPTSSTRTVPGAIERDLPVTPIPDLEASKPSGKVKPPQLLRLEDRTAALGTTETRQLVRYQSAAPSKPVAQPYRVIGDEAWSSLKK